MAGWAVNSSNVRIVHILPSSINYVSDTVLCNIIFFNIIVLLSSTVFHKFFLQNGSTKINFQFLQADHHTIFKIVWCL